MDLPFRFIEDSGDQETAIAINQYGIVKKITNISKQEFEQYYLDGFLVFVPDVLDFINKIIIEFEEETGPKKPGAKLARKGHGHEGDLDTKRDYRRNKYYQYGEFFVIRVWESNFKIPALWKAKLAMELLEHHRKILEAKVGRL